MPFGWGQGHLEVDEPPRGERGLLAQAGEVHALRTTGPRFNHIANSPPRVTDIFIVLYMYIPLLKNYDT